LNGSSLKKRKPASALVSNRDYKLGAQRKCALKLVVGAQVLLQNGMLIGLALNGYDGVCCLLGPLFLGLTAVHLSLIDWSTWHSCELWFVTVVPSADAGFLAL
jgi:hypothetical protein